jgi:hypothetical protein
MRALGWILVWLVLLVASAGYLWTKVRVTWRTSRDLGAELHATEARLSQVRAQVDRLREGTDTAVQELAVFGSASALRTEGHTTRRTLAKQRRARRAESLPAWARRVHS